MKRILVIDREFGAGGSSIAETVAQRLGWTLLDQNLTQAIARLAKTAPEECRHREERADLWLKKTCPVWR